MKIKIMTGVLGLITAATLLTGCSTANKGAMGSDTEIGAGTAAGGPPSGPNGSVSRSNPFGLGVGTGATAGNTP